MPRPSAYVRILGVDELPPVENYTIGDMVVINGTPDMYVHTGSEWTLAGMSGIRAMHMATFQFSPGDIVSFTREDGLADSGILIITSDNNNNYYPGGAAFWYQRGDVGNTYMQRISYNNRWTSNDYHDPGSGYFRIWVQRNDPAHPVRMRNASSWTRNITVYHLPTSPTGVGPTPVPI